MTHPKLAPLPTAIHVEPPRRQSRPYVAELRESHASGEPVTLPPVPPAEVPRIVAALRRAATLTDLGCSIRKRPTPKGIEITYRARVRR